MGGENSRSCCAFAQHNVQRLKRRLQIYEVAEAPTANAYAEVAAYMFRINTSTGPNPGYSGFSKSVR